MLMCVSAQRTMVTTIRDDPFAPKLAGPNHLTYAPRLDPYTVTSPKEKWTKQTIASPYRRLHSTATHNTSPTRVRNGGLVRPPDSPKRPISSESFFRPNKFDMPKTGMRPMLFSHEYRIVSNPSPETVGAYRNFTPDAPRPSSPLRIVRHEPKSSTLPKRNPDLSAKGVSRNFSGGFYAK